MLNEFEEIVLKKLEKLDEQEEFNQVVLEKFEKQEEFNQVVLKKFEKQEEFNQVVLKKFEKQEEFNQVVLKKFEKQEEFNQKIYKELRKMSLDFARFEFEINEKIATLFDAYSVNKEKLELLENNLICHDSKIFNHDIRIEQLENKSLVI